MAEITVPKGVNFTSSYVPETKELSPMERKSLEEKFNGMTKEEKRFVLRYIDDVLLTSELERRIVELRGQVNGIKSFAENFLR
jgi:hypothetical protein